MSDKYIVYQIESIVNKKLYKQNIIDFDTYKKVENRLSRLAFELQKNNLLER